MINEFCSWCLVYYTGWLSTIAKVDLPNHRYLFEQRKFLTISFRCSSSHTVAQAFTGLPSTYCAWIRSSIRKAPPNLWYDKSVCRTVFLAFWRPLHKNEYKLPFHLLRIASDKHNWYSTKGYKRLRVIYFHTPNTTPSSVLALERVQHEVYSGKMRIEHLQWREPGT